MSEDENKFVYGDLTEKIIWAAYKVHNELWRWLQEKVYKKALKYVLEKMWFVVEEEKKIDLKVDGKVFWYWKIDLLVNWKIAVELKSVPKLKLVFNQLRKYLSEKVPVWLIVNFYHNKVQVYRLDYNYKTSFDISWKSSDIIWKSSDILTKWIFEVFNLWVGRWLSVLDMVKMVEEVWWKEIPYEIVERRPWDLAEVYCDPTKANEVLWWKAETEERDSIRNMIRFYERRKKPE